MMTDYILALLAGRARVEPADAERREAPVELPVEGVSCASWPP